MPVVRQELGWTLGHLDSRLKSVKNLHCDLGQAKCLNTQPRSLKLCLQCVRALVGQPGWACVIHSGCSEQLHFMVFSKQPLSSADKENQPGVSLAEGSGF